MCIRDRIEKVSFDKDKCEIILSNLLINALKHSPQDTEITIASELLPEENRVRISVFYLHKTNGSSSVQEQTNGIVLIIRPTDIRSNRECIC